MGEVPPVGLDGPRREARRREGKEALDGRIRLLLPGHARRLRPATRDACSNGGVERRHVIIYGRVQGVGFRFGVERAANTRSVAGWVRNRPDGTVEAVFEGEL